MWREAYKILYIVCVGMLLLDGEEVIITRRTKSCPVVLATCITPLSGVLTHPSMYKVSIRWYNLSLICIGWIPGPDFGALGMCSSHWKVVKGVMQPRTWENGGYVT